MSKRSHPIYRDAVALIGDRDRIGLEDVAEVFRHFRSADRGRAAASAHGVTIAEDGTASSEDVMAAVRRLVGRYRARDRANAAHARATRDLPLPEERKVNPMMAGRVWLRLIGETPTGRLYDVLDDADLVVGTVSDGGPTEATRWRAQRAGAQCDPDVGDVVAYGRTARECADAAFASVRV